jgi:regulator of sirC expression with transglutaminase-like and TPR domain
MVTYFRGQNIGHRQSADVLPLSLALIAVVSSTRLNLSLAQTTFPHMKVDSLIPAYSNKNNEH